MATKTKTTTIKSVIPLPTTTTTVVEKSTNITKNTEFDEELFETRLETLKDTQDGIQAMSTWCLAHRAHHKKIVTCWLNVFKRVRVEHRLTLFYLANDVIQYSKRKRYEFVEAWATALQRATTMVRDAKVKGKILRIFQIWEQREIYNEEFLTDLSGLLNIAPPKRNEPTTEPGENEFQCSQLVQGIRDCLELATVTDKSFKKLPQQPSSDIDEIKLQLKDKMHHQNISGEIDRYVTYITAFKKNVEDEIKSRKQVITNLTKAVKYYTQQRSDVKVVVTAYKNFGNRIKLVKKKIDELEPEFPSPIPSPDINAPSPERDTELKLPDEDPSPPSTSFFNNTGINGYTSYMNEKLPFNLNDFKSDSPKNKSQPIEVIGSRSDDECYTPGGGNSDISTISANFYKPESIGLGLSSYGGEINIPGLNPLPVPPVAQSEYTSLARASHQYVNNSATDYLSSYRADAGYGTDMYGANTSTSDGRANNSLVGRSGRNDVSSEDYASSWDMTNISSWSAPSNAQNPSFEHASSMDTPVSPHFETSTAHEFADHNSSNSSTSNTQDVDHRQLNMSSDFMLANAPNKLGLSKEKTRQLDIDHRNLISLTGSPVTNETNKKSHWPTTNNNNARYLSTSEDDLDYLPTGSMMNANTTKTIENGGVAEVKSTVVDMDMSDEDLELLYQDVNGIAEMISQKDDNLGSPTTSHMESWDLNMQPSSSSSRSSNFPPPPPPPPPPLPAAIGNWPLHWNSGGMPPGVNDGPPGIPSPPRPPAPFSGMPYGPAGGVPPGNFASPLFNRPPNFNEGRGRGRGNWRDGPPNQFRPYSPRPPHMRNNPYYGRGGMNGTPPRGRGGGNPFRGKFRGNSSWI